MLFLMLAHRLQRWPNIETALGDCLVFVGVLFMHSEMPTFKKYPFINVILLSFRIK